MTPPLPSRGRFSSGVAADRGRSLAAGPLGFRSACDGPVESVRFPSSVPMVGTKRFMSRRGARIPATYPSWVTGERNFGLPAAESGQPTHVVPTVGTPDGKSNRRPPRALLSPTTGSAGMWPGRARWELRGVRQGSRLTDSAIGRLRSAVGRSVDPHTITAAGRHEEASGGWPIRAPLRASPNMATGTCSSPNPSGDVSVSAGR
jgi:hypothetical protein